MSLNQTTYLSNLTNSTGFMDVVKFTNQTTSGIMGNMLMISLFVIIFLVSLKRQKVDSALLVSSFISFIISLGFVAVKLIPFFYVVFFLSLTVFMGYYVYVTTK